MKKYIKIKMNLINALILKKWHPDENILKEDVGTDESNTC